MKSFQMFTDSQFFVRELTVNDLPLHKHNFFELIYVLEGSGNHTINGNKYDFSKGEVFLLTPEDAHVFHIENPTKLFVIDFTKSFFAKRKRVADSATNGNDVFFQLEYIFHNHHKVTGSVVSTSDRTIFRALVSQLLLEKEKKSFFFEVIIQDIIFLLLNFVARNIQENISQFSHRQISRSKVHDITVFIQQHIYDRESIKVANLAKHFNKTPDYLNRYFKSETGNTIKGYITRYRLKLVETRLKFSDLTISEISAEMNFTDESHLNKAFKKVLGMTAKDYRKAFAGNLIYKHVDEGVSKLIGN